VQFLRQIEKDTTLLGNTEFLKTTSYFRMARACLKETGAYFAAKTEESIPQEMRDYFSLYEKYAPDFQEPTPPPEGHSPPATYPVLRRIRNSDCYEVVDGHHRLAIQIVQGKKEAAAVVLGKTRTYLQEALLKVNQIHGVELYQPVPFPEVASWRLVRQCQDRFSMMHTFLEERNLFAPGDRSLDCGCSYGWFVAQFQKLGYQAFGLDRDPKATRIGEMCYGLKEKNFLTEKLEAFLRQDGEPYEVVLFLSLLHHFARGHEPGSPEEVLKQVARRTGKVLFLDTGQGHEGWFSRELPEWDPEFIQKFLIQHGEFSEVTPLGVDADNVESFHNQYRRTLFACLR
jgi:SAM-dependent methyltransferase